MNQTTLKSSKDYSVSDEQKQFIPLKEEVPPEQIRTKAALVAARFKSKLEANKGKV